MLTRFLFIAFIIVSSGCSSQLDVLKIERNQLLSIDNNMKELSELSQNDKLSPQNYDIHVQIGYHIFEDLLASLDGQIFNVVANDRNVEIEIKSVGVKFKAGSMIAKIDAKAKDLSSDLIAELVMDGMFTMTRTEDDILAMKFNATSIAPSLSWRWFSISKFNFVRDLATLEVYKVTENLPEVNFPFSQVVDIGIVQTKKVEKIPTGRGSITGIVKTPKINISGEFTLENIVILENGVHLLANLRTDI